MNDFMQCGKFGSKLRYSDQGTIWNKNTHNRLQVQNLQYHDSACCGASMIARAPGQFLSGKLSGLFCLKSFVAVISQLFITFLRALLALVARRLEHCAFYFYFAHFFRHLLLITFS